MAQFGCKHLEKLYSTKQALMIFSFFFFFLVDFKRINQSGKLHEEPMVPSKKPVSLFNLPLLNLLIWICLGEPLRKTVCRTNFFGLTKTNLC